MRPRTTPSSIRPGIPASTTTTNGWSATAWRSIRRQYFIIIPNMFGNGLSSSPSNTPEPYNAAAFSRCHRLRQREGPAPAGRRRSSESRSHQAGHWLVDGRPPDLPLGSACIPDMVERIAPFCGSAKCSRHNFVFLEGVKAALTADDAWSNGWYTKKPREGPARRWRASMPAGASPRRSIGQELDMKKLGFSSLEDFLVGFLGRLLPAQGCQQPACHAVDLAERRHQRQRALRRRLSKALGAIKAKAYVMPGQTDLYFPPEDSENEVAHMPNAELVPYRSIWGHFAGGPGTNPEDVDFIDAKPEGASGKLSRRLHATRSGTCQSCSGPCQRFGFSPQRCYRYRL